MTLGGYFIGQQGITAPPAIPCSWQADDVSPTPSVSSRDPTKPVLMNESFRGISLSKGKRMGPSVMMNLAMDNHLLNKHRNIMKYRDSPKNMVILQLAR